MRGKMAKSKAREKKIQVESWVTKVRQGWWGRRHSQDLGNRAEMHGPCFRGASSSNKVRRQAHPVLRFILSSFIYAKDPVCKIRPPLNSTKNEKYIQDGIRTGSGAWEQGATAPTTISMHKFTPKPNQTRCALPKILNVRAQDEVWQGAGPLLHTSRAFERSQGPRVEAARFQESQQGRLLTPHLR